VVGDRGYPQVGTISALPPDTILKKKGSCLPELLKGGSDDQGVDYMEGRHTKVVRCARDRAGTERLVFGEDVAMDRVLDFTERAVVGRVRGKKLGMDFLKDWVTKTWLPEISKMPHISGYSPEDGLLLSSPHRRMWIGS
jgi:hypothetical protein